MATLKHFASTASRGGHQRRPRQLFERLIREVFLPPFAAAIKEAGARAVMPGLRRDRRRAGAREQAVPPGHPAQGVGLRRLVVSDYFAIEQLNSLHHVVDSDEAAAKLAFESGVDLELPDRSCTRSWRRR
jgi:beta-glucosidase-like glycosyl hydrolase